MKNVDIEIYLNQVITFFEKNPNDLMDLIGELQKDEFYLKLRQRCEKNVEEGKDITLTKEQMINIVVDLKIPDIVDKQEVAVNNIVQKTKFGEIFLN
jgi:uncharacterized protein YecE (DUF72 family)